jgi:DNA-directed RNA polymerase specialized sigma24 family protein/quercetin dioxygenase-like cupin family protein
MACWRQYPLVERTQETVPGTLGAVLYANQPNAPESERDWVALVRAVARGDQAALHALFERTYRPVFTLIMRLRPDRETAEVLTLDVFVDLWRRAQVYDPAQGTVLAWIMNLARARAVAAKPRQLRQSNESLRTALAALRPEERYEIEAAYFAALTRAEAVAPPDQPLGRVKTLIRSGLHKLREVIAGNPETNACAHSELTCAYALWALPSSEVPAAEAHIASCALCERELEMLLPIVAMFGAWPADVLRPNGSLRARLAQRIAALTGRAQVMPAAPQWSEPAWEEVAPGISCKVLAKDTERQLVSMLVRLVPGGSYPAHDHAGVEELHLLNGELWIDDRKLFAGDYNRAEPGTGDQRVMSETGCACVLVTSTMDVLR